MSTETRAETTAEYLSFSEIVYYFAEKSTFHGIPSILTNKKSWLIRLVWLVSFVVSTYFLVLDEIIIVNDYLSFSVHTVVQIKKAHSDTPFPTITLCNTQVCGFNNYSFEYYMDFYLNATYGKHLNLSSAAKLELLQQLEIDELMTAVQNSFLDNHDKQDLARVINDKRTSIDDILISCEFNREPCYAYDFEFFQISELYKCFKFNGGRFFNGSESTIKMTKKHGKPYGLRLKVFSGIQQTCNSPWKVNQGMTIFIHNHTQNASLNSEKIELPAGKETSIAIDRSIVFKQPAPYSKCIVNHAPLQHAHSQFVEQTVLLTKYSQESCMQLCYQDALIRLYNCYDRYLPFLNVKASILPCGRMVDSSQNAVYYDERMHVKQNKSAMCVEQCPIECDHVSFGKTISSSQFPSLSYSEALVYNQRRVVKENKLTERGMNDSILSLDVFYRTSLETVVVETPAMETGIFIASFGGVMGFYLGLSFMSFVEILEFMHEAVLSLGRFIFKPKKFQARKIKESS